MNQMKLTSTWSTLYDSERIRTYTHYTSILISSSIRISIVWTIVNKTSVSVPGNIMTRNFFFIQTFMVIINDLNLNFDPDHDPNLDVMKLATSQLFGL